MSRFEVTISAPGVGKIKHIIRKRTKGEAVEKAKSLYPTAITIKAKRLTE